MQFEWPRFEKNYALESRRNIENDKRFYKKVYYMPSGKSVLIQGNEDKALNQLLQKYDESNLIVEDKNIENCIGIIYYKGLDGKTHRYYPDIYIRSENMIVEVKSSYTYKLQEKTNKIKELACVNAGYRFKFIII